MSMSEQLQPSAAIAPIHFTATVDVLDTHQRWRFWLLAAALIAVGGFVILRLTSLQLFPAERNTGLSLEDLKAQPRGLIVDRNGEVFAADRYNYMVTASPNNIDTDAKRMEVALQLNALLQLPVEQTIRLLSEAYFVANGPLQWVKLAEGIPFELGDTLRTFQADLLARAAEQGIKPPPISQVELTPTPLRYYPQKQLASQIIGFVNSDRQGLYGVERYYDLYLRAEGSGSASNQLVQTLTDLTPDMLRYLPSLNERDLVLTLDRGIQWIIEDELEKGMMRYRAIRGTIIVMDPHSGAILGMASWPDYDPNRFSNEEPSSFINPAISEQYEPGSIFKIITMAAGLNTEVITPTMTFLDPGSVECGTRIIYNANRAANGEVDVTDALALSLNVVTSQVAEAVGEEAFYDYLGRFGFGVPSEVDMGGEIAGAVKSPGDEQWSYSDLCTNSFGQGLAVTPLQMLNATAAIANGGKLMRPYVVDARVQNGRVLKTQPTVVHQVMSKEHAKELTKMMIYTVNYSNQAAAVLGYEVAGKSGTAQVPGPEGYLEDEINASFIGFAPADDPKFVMLVKLERPDYQLTQWADQNAVPIFGQVARRLFLQMNIPPDDVRLGSGVGQ